MKGRIVVFAIGFMLVSTIQIVLIPDPIAPPADELFAALYRANHRPPGPYDITYRPPGGTIGPIHECTERKP